MHERLAQTLTALERRGRRRTLAPIRGIDFSSNDYLGLASSPELRTAVEDALRRGLPVGAGASRLLRGNQEAHVRLEAAASAFFRAESALFFSSGFLANYAVFSTLPRRADLVVYDALIHASVHDGLRSSHAPSVEVPHNDATAFEDAISKWRAAGGRGVPWIAVETLYSMDGDCAPLAELTAVARRHDAMLVLDEAHATGLYGDGGRGLASDEGLNFEGLAGVISVHTCGKALGVMGGLVLGPRVVSDYLINRGRPFVYATAPSPLVSEAVCAALEIVKTQPERRARFHRHVAFAAEALRAHTDFEPSGSQILPIVLGADRRATSLAAALSRRGFDVRAIRPPTVPEGTARLRLSITLNVSEAEIDALMAALAAEYQVLT
ncbi:MAG: 8-amino-7-oxononanoate synthase [Deltaproteobacteria bacterium]|nr:8-amino-7-oxononanoate synthase [Deltaproteobacteria bacterium]